MKMTSTYLSVLTFRFPIHLVHPNEKLTALTTKIKTLVGDNPNVEYQIDHKSSMDNPLGSLVVLFSHKPESNLAESLMTTVNLIQDFLNITPFSQEGEIPLNFDYVVRKTTVVDIFGHEVYRKESKLTDWSFKYPATVNESALGNSIFEQYASYA